MEDPVNGSRQASPAQWLLGGSRFEAPYMASQGTAIGRTGRVLISQSDDAVWVGGTTATVMVGSIELT